jgi:hypothetical protein
MVAWKVGEHRGRCLESEYHDVNLPDLRHEGQREDDRGANQVEADEQGAVRQTLHERGRDRGNRQIGKHLDRERGAEHRPRILAREIVGQQGERDRGDSGADQSQHLGKIQMVVGSLVRTGTGGRLRQ